MKNKFIPKLRLTALLMLVLFTITSCKSAYSELEDGLYAEFVTNKGIMVAKLYFNKTPVTVANFVALSEGNHPLVSEDFKNKKYYNGTVFHRVIDNFMIQGGDPSATGSGSPGYKFDDEFKIELTHKKPGILSMANSGPNTNGSQFFIIEKPTPHLDYRHNVFGELVIGLDVLDTISNVKKGLKDKPINDVVIQELNIIRKGKEAKRFNASETFTTELPFLKDRMVAFQEEQKEFMKEEAEKAKQNFIKQNENLKGRVVNLPTGVTLIYTKEGKGPKPKPSQYVQLKYAGFFENGNLFDTNIIELAKEKGNYNKTRDERGGYKTYDIKYNNKANAVPGFREAVLQMKVGDKCRVFIPSYMAYGTSGRAPFIPPNTNLIFDLEITGIAK